MELKFMDEDKYVNDELYISVQVHETKGHTSNCSFSNTWDSRCSIAFNRFFERRRVSKQQAI